MKVKGKRKDTRKNEEEMRALIKMTEEKDAKKDRPSDNDSQQKGGCKILHPENTTAHCCGKGCHS